MQNAIIADFSNHRGQTTQIYSDDETIEDNYKKTIDFINNLGDCDNSKMSSNNNPLLNDYSKVWIDVKYEDVLSYLKTLSFPKQSSIIQDYDSMETWFKEQFDNKVVENWHVVLSGVMPGDDVAKVRWGSEWCMPTVEQWEELQIYTTHQWTTQNGVYGELFSSTNNKSIFLPAAGYYKTSFPVGLNNQGDEGCYLSSSGSVYFRFVNKKEDIYVGGTDPWSTSINPNESGNTREQYSVRLVKTEETD